MMAKSHMLKSVILMARLKGSYMLYSHMHVHENHKHDMLLYAYVHIIAINADACTIIHRVKYLQFFPTLQGL